MDVEELMTVMVTAAREAFGSTGDSVVTDEQLELLSQASMAIHNVARRWQEGRKWRKQNGN